MLGCRKRKLTIPDYLSCITVFVSRLVNLKVACQDSWASLPRIAYIAFLCCTMNIALYNFHNTQNLLCVFVRD